MESINRIRRMLVGVAATTGMIYRMVIGASVFNYFVAVSHVPEQLPGTMR